METPKKVTIQSALCPSPSKPPQPKHSTSQPAKPPTIQQIFSKTPPENHDS